MYRRLSVTSAKFRKKKTKTKTENKSLGILPKNIGCNENFSSVILISMLGNHELKKIEKD